MLYSIWIYYSFILQKCGCWGCEEWVKLLWNIYRLLPKTPRALCAAASLLHVSANQSRDHKWAQSYPTSHRHRLLHGPWVPHGRQGGETLFLLVKLKLFTKKVIGTSDSSRLIQAGLFVSLWPAVDVKGSCLVHKVRYCQRFSSDSGFVGVTLWNRLPKLTCDFTVHWNVSQLSSSQCLLGKLKRGLLSKWREDYEACPTRRTKLTHGSESSVLGS